MWCIHTMMGIHCFCQYDTCPRMCILPAYVAITAVHNHHLNVWFLHVVLAYMRTCIHAYMCTCVHAYMRTCQHAYMRTCVTSSFSDVRPSVCLMCLSHTCVYIRDYPLWFSSCVCAHFFPYSLFPDEHATFS